MYKLLAVYKTCETMPYLIVRFDTIEYGPDRTITVKYDDCITVISEHSHSHEFEFNMKDQIADLLLLMEKEISIALEKDSAELTELAEYARTHLNKEKDK